MPEFRRSKTVRAGLWKGEAAGNDFLLGTGEWAGRFQRDERFIRAVCNRRRGLGADGVLSLFAVENGRLRIVYRNADGSEAAFCGNATRLAARAAVVLLGMSSPVEILTDWKLVGAEVGAEKVRLDLPAPESPAVDITLTTGPEIFHGTFLIYGVPHVLIEETPAFPLDHPGLAGIGARLRFDPATGENGANISFFRREEDGVIRIRSFERGVSGEVLSCASAISSVAWILSDPDGTDLSIIPNSGDIFSCGRHSAGLSLTAPARIIARIEEVYCL